MLRFTEVVAGDALRGAGGAHARGRVATDSLRTVTLTFDDRRRSRLLVRLDDGSEAALMLPRGTILRAGDVLASEGGGALLVRVRAAVETLSVARTADALMLSRGAYHLGNRHVPLQIAAGRLAYLHDHVLDDLARAVGLDVTIESGPFEPEAGGYRSAGSAHRHDHDHDHDKYHDHDHHAHDQAHDHHHAHDAHHHDPDRDNPRPSDRDAGLGHRHR